MAAGRYSFSVEQGAAFSKTVHWYEGVDVNGDPIPRNTTGYAGLLQVRAYPGSPTILWELSTTAGTIDMGGADGSIVLEDTAAHTTALNWSGRAYYDLLVTPPGEDPVRLLEGRVALSPPVTVP